MKSLAIIMIIILYHKHLKKEEAKIDNKRTIVIMMSKKCYKGINCNKINDKVCFHDITHKLSL